jgi:uncharacterized protein YjaG (DUF416 family)
MVAFDEQSVKERLEEIGPRWRLLFAVSCAERLFPVYKLFSERTQQGAPNRLRSTLDQLWESARREETSREQPFLNEYEALIPGDDVERSKRTLLDPLAEDAVATLAYACQCQVTGETGDAVWAARRGYEAVDYVAHGLEDMDYDTPEAQAAILQKDYVQAELQRQLRDIGELERAAGERRGTEHVVETFRGRAMSEGMTLVTIVSALCK